MMLYKNAIKLRSDQTRLYPKTSKDITRTEHHNPVAEFASLALVYIDDLASEVCPVAEAVM